MERENGLEFADLNCYITLYKACTSIDITCGIKDYTTFLSEAEYKIGLLCIFTGIHHILAAFDTINLKNYRAGAASGNETIGLFGLNVSIKLD